MSTPGERELKKAKKRVAAQGKTAEIRTADIIAEDIQYSQTWFVANNWISAIAKDNNIIIDLDGFGASVWLAVDGEIWYRTHSDETPIKAPASRAKLVLGNILGRKIKLISGTEEHPADIDELDLLLVVRDIFDPFKRKEFFQVGSGTYRNTFNPTKYMMMESQNLPEPKAILTLIRHLSGEEHFEWVLNWFAQFFQTLEKSQVSLVFRGAQGAGKGILWNEVIQPLYGMDSTIQVNDKALETNFLGGIVEMRLFYNLDEISHNIASSKKVKNFLKALVTNPSISVEKKNKNLEKETPIYGQILITSNEPYVIEVEPGDRRFTVLITGEKLSKVNYLGYGNYISFVGAIRKEIPYFANYLKKYKIDAELASTALDTKAKTALIHATNDKFTMFANAIKNRDIAFFVELEDERQYLYDEVKENFEKHRIDKMQIKTYFEYLFGKELSSKEIMQKLRAIDPALFDEENIFKSGNKRFVKLNI